MADNDPLARLIRGLDYEYKDDPSCLLCDGPTPCVTVLCEVGLARAALNARRERDAAQAELLDAARGVANIAFAVCQRDIVGTPLHKSMQRLINAVEAAERARE